MKKIVKTTLLIRSKPNTSRCEEIIEGNKKTYVIENSDGDKLELSEEIFDKFFEVSLRGYVSDIKYIEEDNGND